MARTKESVRHRQVLAKPSENLKVAKSKKREKGDPVEKKPHRYLPGTRALWEISKIQKKSHRDPVVAVSRIKSIILAHVWKESNDDDVYIQTGLAEAIGDYMEKKAVRWVKDASKLAAFRGAKAPKPRDFEFLDKQIGHFR